MKGKRKVISFMLSICLVLVACGYSLGTTGKSVQAAKSKKVVMKQAQKKLKISKKKVTMQPDGKKKLTLKVSNAKKKVSWKSSDKKVAVINKTKGKKKNQAVILAKGEGCCNIIARAGKQKVICKVTVKSPNTSDSVPDDTITPIASKGAVGVYVTSATATGKSITVKVKIYNYTDKMAHFGYAFSIDKWSEGKWVEVESAELLCFPAVAMIIPGQNDSIEFTYSMPKAKEEFVTGKYKINTSLSAGDNTPVYNSAEFWLSVK